MAAKRLGALGVLKVLERTVVDRKDEVLGTNVVNVEGRGVSMETSRRQVVKEASGQGRQGRETRFGLVGLAQCQRVERVFSCALWRAIIRLGDAAITACIRKATKTRQQIRSAADRRFRQFVFE